MRSIFTFFCLVIAILAILLPYIPNVVATEYVSRKGFVTLQFDDSHYPHYTHIYPLLELHGVKGSFGYVTESSALGTEHDAWMMQEIYQAGHEVQDHTTRHDYRWATHVDTVRDDIRDWIPYTLADVATWDSLCQHSLIILDSLGIEVVGWNEPGGGPDTQVPGHPDWSWLGAENDSLYELIGARYEYALGYGVSPFTAHFNLRGHNCPERYPFFNVPHWTIDKRSMDDVITDIADAVASGLWYLAVSHGKDLHQVAQVETLVEWLSANDIEVLTCHDAVQRLTLERPDPLCNQFPQAKMVDDKDGNCKPDGFIGACTRDTLTPPPVPDVGCMLVFGEVDSFCYGPELGTNAVSMWLKSAADGPTSIRIILVRLDFDWQCLGYTNTLVQVPTEWVKIDSTTHTNFLLEIGDEVDRVLIRFKAAEGDTILAVYPEFVLAGCAGVETAKRAGDGSMQLRVSPNPVRHGSVVTITPACDARLYDALGRYVLTPRSLRNPGVLTIDASEVAPGVYFIRDSGPGQRNARLVVIR